ncbi:MAG: hypothetical protein IJ009_05450 [Clostridia bacterium]|nr:hypothetical protein [Clostridia bacterium]
MKKLVFVINGRGGVGKDALCDFAARHFRVTNLSTIMPIKDLAVQCGWQGEKTDRARRFLSDLKAVLAAYNDYPTLWAKERYLEFLADENEILFMHIREAEEIEKFVRATDGRAETILIRRAAVHREAYGNRSDDEVEDYTYDYVYDNDLPLEEAGEGFVAFLKGIWNSLTE